MMVDPDCSSGGGSAPSSTSSSSSPLESFLLLANGTRGAATVGLVTQILEAPGIYVFGELLDHPNIQAMSASPEGEKALQLLDLFAFGVFQDYLSRQAVLPALSEPMKKKLRLLTLASLATKTRLLPYAHLQKELSVSNVRELEDLIIEGANNNVITGKLDQRAEHFEVDYTMARDIKKSDIAQIGRTLEAWCNSCEGMLDTLEKQATRANLAKRDNRDHQKLIESKVNEIRGHLHAQQQLGSDGGGADDPDSRMETDRGNDRGGKKFGGGGGGGSSKGKGLRGSGKGTGGFWTK